MHRINSDRDIQHHGICHRDEDDINGIEPMPQFQDDNNNSKERSFLHTEMLYSFNFILMVNIGLNKNSMK